MKQKSNTMKMGYLIKRFITMQWRMDWIVSVHMILQGIQIADILL